MLFVLVLGCVPIATLQRAQTMGYGNWEIGLEPGILAASGVPDPGVGGHEHGAAFPQLAASFRYGVGEQTDLSTRVGPGGFEAGMKLSFTGPRSDVAVSIAPVAGGGYLDTEDLRAWLLYAQVPVLVGVPLAPEHDLAFSGGLLVSTHGAPRDSGNFTTFGLSGSAAYAWQANPRVAIVPQVAAYVPLLRAGEEDLGGPMAAGFLFHAGLGLLLSPPPFWSAR